MIQWISSVFFVSVRRLALLSRRYDDVSDEENRGVLLNLNRKFEWKLVSPSGWWIYFRESGLWSSRDRLCCGASPTFLDWVVARGVGNSWICRLPTTKPTLLFRLHVKFLTPGSSACVLAVSEFKVAVILNIALALFNCRGVSEGLRSAPTLVQQLFRRQTTWKPPLCRVANRNAASCLINAVY